MANLKWGQSHLNRMVKKEKSERTKKGFLTILSSVKNVCSSGLRRRGLGRHGSEEGKLRTGKKGREPGGGGGEPKK